MKEVWLRGPVANVPVLLQPVAHALLQAVEEVEALFEDFDETLLWTRPAGVASPGFHLQHLTGVLDRLFSYAQGLALTNEQLTALRQEGQPAELTTGQLIADFKNQVNSSIQNLITFEHKLKEPRYVGRERIESTVMGLLVHSAEHTMRHIGQLHVTVKILMNAS